MLVTGKLFFIVSRTQFAGEMWEHDKQLCGAKNTTSWGN